MIRLNFEAARSVLCLGAHADDIEIGCGGTVLKLLRARPGMEFVWVVLSADGRRGREARESARAFLEGAGKTRVIIKHFRNGFFPFRGEAIKDFFEELKGSVDPDLVFTHYREDRHQDHRVLSDLAWNTFRDHAILEYEVPKYDGDLGHPNLYVELDKELCQRKVENTRRFFQTQADKHWFSADTFLSLMRLRGVECAARTKYAEAFYCRKLLF
jgi:LmbE family N-acetylglucosaminyl deacetylase